MECHRGPVLREQSFFPLPGPVLGTEQDVENRRKQTEGDRNGDRPTMTPYLGCPII